MEKTTHIILGGIRFDMTEEAFTALDAYLRSLASHFESDPDHTEIIRDIESRIAEKFTESTEKIVTLETVNAVVRQMGSPEDITSEEDEATPAASVRKLYRDTDDMILGGVSSGIAAYFGIDPIIPRIAFILSVFLGGMGIMLYLLLWLLLPPARTASQKLQMRGSAVTIRTMERQIRSTSSALAQNGVFQKIIYFPFELAGSLLRGIGRCMRPLSKLLGVLIAAGSFFAILGITTFTMLAAFNMDAPFMEMPLLEAVSPITIYGLIAALYLSAVIPLVFILMLGQKLVRMHSHISPAIGFGLIGIWSIAVVASGVLGFRTSGEYYEHMQNSPQYQERTEVVMLEPYQRVIVSRGADVRIASGNAQKTEVSAASRDLERISMAVENGSLMIETRPADSACIFCEFKRPVVTITTPTLESVRVHSGSMVTFDDIHSNSLSLDVQGGNIYGSLDVDTLTVEGEDLYLDLEGLASSTIYRVDNATISADRFESHFVSVEAYDYSHVELWSVGSIDAYADETSSIIYRGEPAHVQGNAVHEKEKDTYID